MDSIDFGRSCETIPANAKLPFHFKRALRIGVKPPRPHGNIMAKGSPFAYGPAMSETPISDNPYSAANIEILTGLEAIRRRPMMYVGSLDAPELPSHLLLEAVCHAIDEVIDGTCTAVTIGVTDELSAWVEYDAGMSLEPIAPTGDIPAAEAFLLHVSGCHNLKKHIAIGDRHCRFGLAVLNAFSEELIATTHCSGKSATLCFAKGLMEPYRIELTDRADHTRIAFKLDRTLIPGAFDRALIAREVAALGKDYPQALFLFDGERSDAAD